MTPLVSSMILKKPCAVALDLDVEGEASAELFLEVLDSVDSLDVALIDDNDPVAHSAHLGEDMRAENDGVALFQVS